VGDDATAWWTERCAVEIEGTVDLGVGGELGVDTRAAQEVQGDLGLGEEFVPEGQREVGIDAA